MIRHPDYARGRLRQRAEALRSRVYAATRPVDELLVSPQVNRIPWEEARELEYRPASFGERFGPLRLSGMVIVVCGIAVMLISKRPQVLPEIA